MSWAGYVVHVWKENVCRVLVGKPEEERQTTWQTSPYMGG